MWIKLKSGELFNLDYADKIYSCKLQTNKYAICIRKKVIIEKDVSEVLRFKDGLTEKEAEEEIDDLFFLINTKYD